MSNSKVAYVLSLLLFSLSLKNIMMFLQTAHLGHFEKDFVLLFKHFEKIKLGPALPFVQCTVSEGGESK